MAARHVLDVAADGLVRRLLAVTIGQQVREGDEDARRQLQRRRIATLGLAGGALPRDSLRQLGGFLRHAIPGGIPLVGVARDQLHHARLLAGDQDRRPVRAWATRDQLRVGAVPLALEADLPRPKQRHQHLQRLVEAADPVVERVVEGVELRLVPAAANAQHQPAVADLVQRHGHLGQQGGIAERQREHQRADLDAPRHAGHRGQDRPALVDAGRLLVLAEDQVVGAPHRVQAARVGGLGHGPQLRPGERSAQRVVVAQRQHQADLHSVASPAPTASASICAAISKSLWLSPPAALVVSLNVTRRQLISKSGW